MLAVEAAWVARDPATPAGKFSTGRAVKRTSQAGLLLGDAARMAVGLDVVIDVDFGERPARELVTLAGQRLKKRSIQFFEEA
jgi:PIN domain nuclease of toxin-antitoxin system